MTVTESVLAMYKDNPTLENADIARMLGCSNRMVRKVLNPIRNNEPEKATIKTVMPAKILLFDIETSFMEVWTWRLWQQVLRPDQVMKDWSILSWSAKWLFSDKVMGDVVSPADAHERNDEKLMPDLWALLNEADIIIAHNGNRFDIPRVNTRLLLNGYNPPTPYRAIDTQMVMKRTFQFTSMKMEEVNKALGILQKLEHAGIQMWKDACGGDHKPAMSALTNMLAYNKQDVLALEDLYLMLRPWIKSHPNVNLYQEFTGDKDEIRCANCGSADLDWNSKYYTPAGRFEAFRCGSCGAIGRSRYSDLTATDRKSLGLSVAF